MSTAEAELDPIEALQRAVKAVSERLAAAERAAAEAAALEDDTTAPGRLALGIDEVAQALGVGRATVWRRIREGDIPARKLAGRTVVLVDDLRAYLRGLPIWQPEDD